MVRRTWAPSLVWFCTCQRKMSPTLMWTMSRSAQSSSLWVPLPLPCTPMITYLRTKPLLLVGCADAYRARRWTATERCRVEAPRRGHLEHIALGDQHGRLVIVRSGQAGVAFRRIGIAEPRGDLAGLPDVPESPDQQSVGRPLPAMRLGD